MISAPSVVSYALPGKQVQVIHGRWSAVLLEGGRHQHEPDAFHFIETNSPPTGSASGGGSAFACCFQDVSGFVAHGGFLAPHAAGFFSVFGGRRPPLGNPPALAPAILALVLVGMRNLRSCRMDPGLLWGGGRCFLLAGCWVACEMDVLCCLDFFALHTGA